MAKKTPVQQQPDQEVDPERVKEWRAVLEKSGYTEADLADLMRRGASVEGVESGEMLADLGPKDDEELYQWFKDRIGVEIPRVAVCPGHTAPFEIAADIHSFRLLRVLIIGSRGGAKTSLMAWLDICAAESFPGFGSWTTGPGLSQGERKYEHMLPYVVDGGVIGGKELPMISRSTLTKTIWKNGSQAEIGPGTISANNGPRQPRLHRDELELMDPPVVKQAGNIPASRKTSDGRVIPAQIIDTSTMKWAHGVVAQIKEEWEKAVVAGDRPRTEVRIFCIYECAEEVPSCRMAPKDEREARLKELGKDPCELCDCDTYKNDYWDEKEDGKQPQRSLDQVCNGRLFRSRGFKPHEDIKTLFQENDRETWEAEQECSSPSKEGVYIKGYSQVRNGLKNYSPNPDNGIIYMGIDWGGVDAHSVGWYQLLEHPVLVDSFVGDKKKRLEPGTLIRFAEIYRAGIGNVDLGKMAIAMEDKWRKQWPGWHVHERYPDYQNSSGRMDWEKHLDLKLIWRVKKDFDEEVKYIRTWVGKSNFYVAIDDCPMFDKAIRSWREENGHEARDATSNWATHPMAEMRYVISNLEFVSRKDAVVSRSSASHAELLVEDPEDESPATSGLRTRKNDGNVQVIGVAGAEDSPNRRGTRRIDGPSWS